MSKKAAKNQPKEQTYEIREVVLAKVRGFPAWPGMVRYYCFSLATVATTTCTSRSLPHSSPLLLCIPAGRRSRQRASRRREGEAQCQKQEGQLVLRPVLPSWRLVRALHSPSSQW